jgi:2,4-dienoyl-CoA reductase-like NADH-dependent reductase (Old Yellow Enzyme family)
MSALVFGSPREMDTSDIEHVVNCFAEGAKLSYEAGFAGVEIHAAHGYLLAQFLSAKTNKRTDAYGGSPRKRARIIVDILQAVRSVVPAEFCVGIKLNSVDHQSRRELDECIEQLDVIVSEGIDFLDVSGGTYEDPEVSASCFSFLFLAFLYLELFSFRPQLQFHALHHGLGYTNKHAR